jgi:hypothetical protein
MKLLKYFFISLIFSITIVLGTAVLSQAADSNHFLDTAYIRPRTLVFAKGNFWVYADNKFNEAQKGLIRSASAVLHERMNNQSQRSKILSCANEKSSDGLPSSQASINSQLNRVFVNAASGNRPIKLTTAYRWNPSFSGGIAPVGNSGEFPEKGDLLRIALNADIMNTGKFNADSWAGLMAHEILHNLSYTHPKGQYNGWFIHEFGKCVTFNGETSLGLAGDSDALDQLMKD